MSVRLRVLLDGAELGEAEARDFWQRFSAYMDHHQGDLAGFARGEKLASVHPEVHDGGPVLVASSTAPQRDYTTAPKRKSGDDQARPSGSRPDQRGGGQGRGRRRKAR